jgi:hypothetical protein
MGDAMITLHLKTWEAKHMLVAKKGPGGFGAIHQWALAKLANGNLDIDVTDEELGMLVRHMGYGNGGWQTKMRCAFLPSIKRYVHDV